MVIAKAEPLQQKYYTISICGAEATLNADFLDGGIGYYKRENIVNACPSGFHPAEKREL